MVKYDNSSGAAGIAALFFTFILAGAVLAVSGIALDRITLMASRMFVDVASSQMRFDFFQLQIAIIRIIPAIILLTAGIGYWVTQSRTMSGEIDIGGMLVSTFELVGIQLLMMVMVLFAGSGLDLVVNTVNQWNFVPLQDHYFIIQLLPTVFYAFCGLLIPIAAIALYILKAFEVVDYSTSYDM